MAGDGEDAQPITIDAVDSRGRHVPTANIMAHLKVTGATPIGVGNGDNNCHESEKAPQRSLFNGLAQLIVQADPGRGMVTVTAEAASLRPARLRISRAAVTPRPQVEVTAARFAVDQWRRSPIFAQKPAADLAPGDSDNNSWAFVKAGAEAPAEADAGWRIYRARTKLPRAVAASGGLLAFREISGSAEVWIDNVRRATKENAGRGSATVPLAAGKAERIIVVLVKHAPNVAAGLTGLIATQTQATALD